MLNSKKIKLDNIEVKIKNFGNLLHNDCKLVIEKTHSKDNPSSIDVMHTKFRKVMKERLKKLCEDLNINLTIDYTQITNLKKAFDKASQEQLENVNTNSNNGVHNEVDEASFKLKEATYKFLLTMDLLENKSDKIIDFILDNDLKLDKDQNQKFIDLCMTSVIPILTSLTLMAVSLIIYKTLPQANHINLVSAGMGVGMMSLIFQIGVTIILYNHNQDVAYMERDNRDTKFLNDNLADLTTVLECMQNIELKSDSQNIQR